MYKSEFHNAKETMEILKKCSLDDLFRVYHKKKKGKRRKRMKKGKEKYTLTQIGDALFMLINRFDYVIKTNNLKDLPKQKHAKNK